MQLNDADRFIIASSRGLGVLLRAYGDSSVPPMLLWQRLLRESARGLNERG